MDFLIRVLRLYGWYVATVMAFGLLLVVAVWLRWSLARWCNNRVGGRRGHSHPVR
jgi:hypothetical protein